MPVHKSKYGNRRTAYDGQVYASRIEAGRAADLDLLVRSGQLKSWRSGEPKVLLAGHTRSRRVTYRPDFVVENSCGQSWAEDVKGVDRRTGKPATLTEAFRIKAILWEILFPALPLRVVDGNGAVVWGLDPGVVRDGASPSGGNLGACGPRPVRGADPQLHAARLRRGSR